MSIYASLKSALILFAQTILSIVFGLIMIAVISSFSNVEGENKMCGSISCEGPTIKDPNLKVDMVYQGNFNYEGNSLSPVSSMTFLGSNDVLLLNKNNGTVYRIVNNISKSEPLVDVNVANERERGLLGIATHKDNNNKTYVYLYYTESEQSDGRDVCPKKWHSDAHHCNPDSEPIGNRLYKYELKNNKLINPKLLLELPSSPSPTHNGGVIRIGPDDNLYVTIGDLLGSTNINSSTKAQNLDGPDPDGRSGILRITQDGRPSGEGILGNSGPLQMYYAYGIRNSFGIDFDPLTGNLWDTENGPEYGDEINLVQPGFNSGWERIQGIWAPIENKSSYISDLIPGEKLLNPNDRLVDFDGKGKYSSPEFIWKSTIGVTAAKFLNSDALGKKYENDLFIGSFKHGIIFHFDLIKDRTELKLNGSLSDKMAETEDELDEITFVRGIGGVTDIDIGPDGYMYILSNYLGKPTIFRISLVER